MTVTSKKYLLSIDGGGIRGIIPLYALVKLEVTTGKLCRDIFSFVAGTSTGAVIAAALVAGVPASKILHLYTHRHHEIFNHKPWSGLKRLIFGWMYSTESLNKIVKEELGSFSELLVKDSPVDIFIPAKRVSDGMPIYFVREQEDTNVCRFCNVKLADCVTASAAAPTYFYPWKIENQLLTDGAIGVAGNPVYEACVEAFYYTKKYTPENTVVISLGTGQFAEAYHPTDMWSWFNWILRELLSSPGEQQTEIVRRHFPTMQFYRLDPDLKELDPTLVTDIPLDSTRDVDRLIQYGNRFAELINWSTILDGSDEVFRVRS